MQRYILAIDQGTTGTTALIFDADLNIRGKQTVEFPQHFPEPSWVEHDLDEIWQSVLTSVKRVFEESRISPQEIAAVGITNQRETTCLWHRENGKPYCKAIVWQDRRTFPQCEALKKKGWEKEINKKTGLLLDPYFSGTKISWILKEDPNALRLSKAGKLAFGTIESFLLFRMSGEHKTDVTNASRTLLMNLKTCEWDEDLLKLFKVPRSILPKICPSAVLYGKTKGFSILPDGVPITGMIGDQQAALFGQACFSKGSAKSTYGTGAFVLLNTGEKPIFSKHRLLTTVAWQLGNKVTYGLEGSSFIAGAAVQWIRDGLKLVSKSSEIEALAETVPDSDGVVFVPALSGMGAPHWLATATGMLTGITRRTQKGNIARAALDGIAFQVAELVEAMEKDFDRKITPLKVDGGASANDLLMQIQANFLGIKVVRSEISETTALGAGLQAGLGVGFWKDCAEIEKKWKSSKSFEAKISSVQRKKEMDRWHKTMKAVKLLSQIN